MINISVIIPNYNGAKYLKECLKHLIVAIKNCPNLKFEIILVDNASTDNSIKIFKNFLNAQLNYSTIQLNTNTGFATAVNQGIKKANYKYVFLLNNDVNLDKDYFKIITQSIKRNPQIACFCGSVFNKDGSAIESQGISFDWSGKCLQINHYHPFKKSNLSSQDSIPVWGSSGAAVIYQKEIIKKIGLFDEHYFAYIEDVDLAFRLQKNNFQTLLVPQACVYHLGGATSNQMGNFRARQIFKNWLYFIFKNYSSKEIFKHFPKIFIERLRNLSYLIKSSINK